MTNRSAARVQGSVAKAFLVVALAWNAAGAAPLEPRATPPVQLITLDPGHFHAALFQKEMLPEIAARAHVYAPLGPDLTAHLNRIAQFNSRAENPTHWELEVHASLDCLNRLLDERPGNVVVLSGNNRGKVDRIGALVNAGFHVLADKPWTIEPEELPRLQAALEAAQQKGVAAYDAMTQRFEISCLLTRYVVQDPEVFGTCLSGSVAEPAVEMESVHYLIKEVAGSVLLRPPWFFDVRQQGEGLTDVGTHLVDLVQWTLFPNQAIDYRNDIAVLRGAHWPTTLSLAQFQAVTAEKTFPPCVQGAIQNNVLQSFANNTVTYALRGTIVRLNIEWKLEPPPGAKDTEFAVFRGTRSRIEVRQGQEEKFIPELYVLPNRPEFRPGLRAALERKLESIRPSRPGLELREHGEGFQVVIPERDRVGHEAHFALLIRQFLGFVRDPKSSPPWEVPNMLAKYFVTTQGVKLARENPRKEKP